MAHVTRGGKRGSHVIVAAKLPALEMNCLNCWKSQYWGDEERDPRAVWVQT